MLFISVYFFVFKMLSFQHLLPVASTIIQTNAKYVVGAFWLATVYLYVYMWSNVVFVLRAFISWVVLGDFLFSFCVCF